MGSVQLDRSLRDTVAGGAGVVGQVACGVVDGEEGQTGAILYHDAEQQLWLFSVLPVFESGGVR